MNTADVTYLNLLREILEKGHVEKNSRTGVGTKSIFGVQVKFDMAEGLPILTTKKMFTKGIVTELLWFMGNHLSDHKYKKLGRTNVKYLVDHKVNIWVGDLYKRYLNSPSDFPHLTELEFINKLVHDTQFADMWGNCGPIYGHQWCAWGEKDYHHGINQLKEAIHKLKTNPTDRRIMVSAWNVTDIAAGEMVLPPCHYSFTCYTRLLTLGERIELTTKCPEFDVLDFGIGPNNEDRDHYVCDAYKVPRRALSLKWNQRSVDTAVGLCFNIASYAILLEMLAKEAGMVAETLIGSLENTHVYLNQIDAVNEHLGRTPKHKLPTLWLNPNKSIFEYTIDDVKIQNYESQDKIVIPMSF